MAGRKPINGCLIEASAWRICFSPQAILASCIGTKNKLSISRTLSVAMRDGQTRIFDIFKEIQLVTGTMTKNDLKFRINQNCLLPCGWVTISQTIYIFFNVSTWSRLPVLEIGPKRCNIGISERDFSVKTCLTFFSRNEQLYHIVISSS